MTPERSPGRLSAASVGRYLTTVYTTLRHGRQHSHSLSAIRILRTSPSGSAVLPARRFTEAGRLDTHVVLLAHAHKPKLSMWVAFALVLHYNARNSKP